MAKILGIKKAVMTSGKNEGKTGITYFMSKDFSDYDKSVAECAGECVSSEFSYTDFNVMIGDDVTPIYEKGYQDKAVLVNLIPFKPSK